VAAVIVDALDGLNLAYPKVDAQRRKELEAARKTLFVTNASDCDRSGRPFNARIDQIVSGWEPLRGWVVASKSPAGIENSEHPIPIAERVELSCGRVFSCGPAIHNHPDHSFLRASRARRASRGGVDRASSGSPVCLICLMAPAISALILLVAFFTLSGSTVFVGGLQMRPNSSSILSSFIFALLRSTWPNSRPDFLHFIGRSHFH